MIRTLRHEVGELGPIGWIRIGCEGILTILRQWQRRAAKCCGVLVTVIVCGPAGLELSLLGFALAAAPHA